MHTDNYKQTLNKPVINYILTYKKLIIEFIDHSINSNIFKNKTYFLFIIKRGLIAIKHIFKMLLLYTKNLEFTVYHCKKAYVYYIEFIGQIGEDGNTYLQLNSKDATLFIYKKSIYEINNDYKKKFTINKKTKKIMDIICKFTNVLNKLLNMESFAN